MKNIGELSADGYGMAVFATDVFNSYMKEKKCRAKKYLSYFDKNKEFFYQTIKDGIFLPIYRLCSFQYEIFVSVNEGDILHIPEGYRQVFRYNGFYAETGKQNKLCFASFSFVEYSGELIKQNIADKSNQIPTGPEEILENYNSAIGFDLPEGKYRFDLVGLKRINPLQRESKNYAYLFIFHQDNNAVNDNFNKGDDEVFIFDIYEQNKLINQEGSK